MEKMPVFVKVDEYDSVLSLLKTIQKKLEEAKDTIVKINDLKNVKDGSNLNAIKNASQALAQATQKIGEILYKQPTPRSDSGQATDNQQPTTDSQGEKKDDNIKDAEFEDK